MASTGAAKAKSRRYYKTHKKYREEKIEQAMNNQKANREEYNKSKREYYAKNEAYKKYKRAYAARYRKEEPEKSKARKYRGTAKRRRK